MPRGVVVEPETERAVSARRARWKISTTVSVFVLFISRRAAAT
jgi:hypothetical protein